MGDRGRVEGYLLKLRSKIDDVFGTFGEPVAVKDATGTGPLCQGLETVAEDGVTI